MYKALGIDPAPKEVLKNSGLSHWYPSGIPRGPQTLTKLNRSSANPCEQVSAKSFQFIKPKVSPIIVIIPDFEEQALFHSRQLYFVAPLQHLLNLNKFDALIWQTDYQFTRASSVHIQVQVIELQHELFRVSLEIFIEIFPVIFENQAVGSNFRFFR